MEPIRIILALVLLTAIQAMAGSVTTTAISVTAEVYFSPNGRCTDAIVAELAKARSKILVEAYSFTSRNIAKALVDAYQE